MDFETNQAEQIKPSDELRYAQEGLNAEDWGEVENCLQEFAKKVTEASPSADERADLETRLLSLKQNIYAGEIPEAYKDRIATAIEVAEQTL